MRLYYNSILQLSNSEGYEGLTGLVKEILHSQDNRHFSQPAIEDEEGNPYHEVKLLINGIETEPKLLGTIIGKFVELIDKEAEALMINHLEEKENALVALKAKYIEELDSILL